MGWVNICHMMRSYTEWNMALQWYLVVPVAICQDLRVVSRVPCQDLRAVSEVARNQLRDQETSVTVPDVALRLEAKHTGEWAQRSLGIAHRSFADRGQHNVRLRARTRDSVTRTIKLSTVNRCPRQAESRCRTGMEPSVIRLECILEKERVADRQASERSP